MIEGFAGDNFDDTPDDNEYAFIMRNIEPEYVEALHELLTALLEENTAGLEVKVSLNECEGYQIHHRILEYVQTLLVIPNTYLRLIAGE